MDFDNNNIKTAINYLNQDLFYNNKLNTYRIETPMNARLNWSLEEQKLLQKLKQQENIDSWKKIAQILNSNFPETSRSGKQCRDRYVNFVRFNSETPKIIGWTQQEDFMLFQKIQQYGSKWVLISSEMPGRSQNNLKNRFYGAIRKIMRKIVKAQKQMRPKPKKFIKQKCIIKLFEQCRKSRDSQLYRRLLRLATSQQQLISTNQVKEVISAIHQISNNTKVLNKKADLKQWETAEASKSTNSLIEKQQVSSKQINCQNIWPDYQPHIIQESIQLKKSNNLMKSLSIQMFKNGPMVDFSFWPFEQINPLDQIFCQSQEYIFTS